MHHVKRKWGRILLTVVLSTAAGLAGNRSTAETVTVRFRGYHQSASWLFGTDTSFAIGAFDCLEGATGNGKPVPVSSVNINAEVDTESAWTNVFTSGLVDAPDAEIVTVGPNLNGTGSCSVTGLPGTKWEVDLATFTVTEGPATLGANASMSAPGEIVHGVSRQTTRNRTAGETTRTHTTGKTGFDVTGVGGISVDGAPFIADGTALWSANSFMANVHEGTSTHTK